MAPLCVQKFFIFDGYRFHLLGYPGIRSPTVITVERTLILVMAEMMIVLVITVKRTLILLILTTNWMHMMMTFFSMQMMKKEARRKIRTRKLSVLYQMLKMTCQQKMMSCCICLKQMMKVEKA